MSEDIKKTISELHIYEKKLLKELESNQDANPEDIAENTGMDIKSVMSAAGSLASKDIIEVDKEVQKTYSLTDDGLKYAEHGLPERKILDVLAEKKEIPMKDLASEAGIDKKETGIALGWLRRKDWAQIDKGVVNVTDFGMEFADKLGAGALKGGVNLHAGIVPGGALGVLERDAPHILQMRVCRFHNVSL